MGFCVNDRCGSMKGLIFMSKDIDTSIEKYDEKVILGLIATYGPNLSFAGYEKAADLLVRAGNCDDRVRLAAIVKKHISSGGPFNDEYFAAIRRRYFIPEEAVKAADPHDIIGFIDYMATIEEQERKLTVEALRCFFDNSYLIPQDIYKDLNGESFDDFIKAVGFVRDIVSNEAYIKIDDAKLFKDASAGWTIGELSAVKYCVNEKISADVFKKASDENVSAGTLLEKIKIAGEAEIKKCEEKESINLGRINSGLKAGAAFLVLCAALYYYLWFGIYLSIPSDGRIIAQNYLGYYGIISNGKWIRGPQFDWIGQFDKKYKLAKVYHKKRYGFINIEGWMAVEPIFQSVDDLGEDGTAKMRMNFKYGVIDKDGKIIIDAKYDDIFKFSTNGKDEFAKVKLNGKYGLINKSGKVLIEPLYDELDLLSYHLRAVKVKRDGRKGVIGIDGRIIIQPLYDEIVKYDPNAITVVRLNGKLGGIDKNGKMVLEPIYDSIGDFFFKDQLTARIRLKNKEGLINIKGEILIKPLYDYIGSFQTGYRKAVNIDTMKIGKKYGLIDITGKVIAEAIYDHISVYPEHGVAVISRNQKYGLMDLNGKVLAEPFYDDIGRFNIHGVAEIELNNKKGNITKEGAVLIKPE